MAMEGDRNSRPVALGAVALLVGSTLALALAAPASADLSTSGVWIFPHERQSAAVNGTLGQYYYNTTSGDDWIADAFFADADADGATVDVDFYNPTGGDLTNVILWVAVSDDSLFTSVDFSGGASGDMSVGVDDLGGGTPTTGSSLPDYVYPAFYTSYGVGDIDAGDVATVTLDVTGDFEGGLVLRLDYVATDANDDDISGPFDAGMSIYDWGDLPANDGQCPDGAGVEVGLSLTPDYVRGEEFDVALTISLTPSADYVATDVTLDLKSTLAGLTLDELGLGDLEQYGTGTTFDIGSLDQELVLEATLTGSPLLLPGDETGLTLEVSWDGCDGGGHVTSTATEPIGAGRSGSARSPSSWAGDLHDALRADGQGHRHTPDYNESQYDTFMQAIALHSDVFTYGDWDGEDPFGGTDAGWVDISDLSDARDILLKRGSGQGNVKEMEQELLALWLNVASGRVNLDSELQARHHGCERGHGRGDDDDDGDGGSGSSLDVQGIVSNAESTFTDYVEAGDDSGGHGHGHGAWRSASQLWGATVLCWMVNSGWLRAVS